MKTKEFRIHINAVFNAIDHLLSEWIPVEEITDKDKEIHGELCLNGELQQLRAIDTRSPEALKALAENRLTRYLKAHPDNSLQLFVDTEVNHAKLYKEQLDKYLNDSKQKTYYFRLERWIKTLEEMLAQQAEAKPKKLEAPQTFEELFYNPEHAEPCLSILRELQPPVIDAINNYIGKAKGVLPLWIKVLQKHNPKPLIKPFKDSVYKDLLNQKIKGLNLSKDASEFRKQYKRVENDKTELDIKTILSQYSQSGKLGK
jgi:hypothetical protein